MFRFFLKGYRSGILSFSGSTLNIKYNSSSVDAMFGFREYDNGRYKGQSTLKSKHPNILIGVITGKKAWGLWVNEWIDGIAEGNFTKYEILSQFGEHGIEIPDKLLQDFENRLWQKRFSYLDKKSDF